MRALRRWNEMADRGVLIVLEGPEGSGKTTQADLLRRYLEGRGMEVVLVREPGGTETGRRIRRILKEPGLRLVPEAELLLFEASRAQLVREVLVPALERGAAVVCDRFTLSTEVYQGAAGGLDSRLVASLNRFATGGLEPDLVVVLDLTAARGRRRLGIDTADASQGFLFADRQPDRIERRSKEFHRRVVSAYRRVARRRGRVHLLAAEAPPGEIHEEIVRLVERLLRSRGGTTRSDGEP